jgi:hypothetical protein
MAPEDFHTDSWISQADLKPVDKNLQGYLGIGLTDVDNTVLFSPELAIQ